LRLLKEALDENPGAALAAPAVRDSRGRLEKAAVRQFPDPWNSLVTLLGLWRLGRWIPWLKGVPLRPDPSSAGPVVAEAVSGACMLIRREPVLEMGMLDEEYGLHCEDLDLMYRLHEAGWDCLYLAAADAVHEQGVSSRSRPMWVHLQKHRGMARFFGKFQADRYMFPLRWLVHAGIWMHYVFTLPLAWMRK